MAIAQIKLTYKYIIDAASQTDFERNIFHASYQEFLLKSQAYNKDADLHTFTQMKARDGRANSLHYKISFAALHFLNDLNNKIPGLHDALGNSVDYETPVFELIESDTSQINNHKVAVKFITGTLILHQVIEDIMVLSLEDHFNQGNLNETFTLRMQPLLAITSYKEIVPAAGILKPVFKVN